MKRPLYKGHKPAAGLQGHAGLWYEKYCDQWRGDGLLNWGLGAKDKQTPKADWVDSVVTGEHAIGTATTLLLQEHHARMNDLCARSHGVQQVFQTAGRLVIGIGQDHPVENGFLWHPTLGVPYIPGSSIKGMLRNWVLGWEGRDDKTAWFEGTEGKGVGELIFLDALPLAIPKLMADVITPHYTPYYRDPEHTPPADWHSPTPTPFLTVAAGVRFAVRVLKRRSNPKDTAELGPLLQALGDAFDTLGIGAKTAAGCGRLSPVKEKIAAVKAIDPLEEFKLFCTRFGSVASNKGAPEPMVKKLLELSETTRALAIRYLIEVKKTKRRDCGPSLAAILFAEEQGP